MTPFKDPRLRKVATGKRKVATGKPADCETCTNCVIPVQTGQKIPPNFPKFCMKEKRYLMRYFSGENWITGIEKAETCPNYKAK